MNNAADSVHQNATALLAMANIVRLECQTDAIYRLCEEPAIREAAAVLNQIVAQMDAVDKITITGGVCGKRRA
jgi:hypothetical protein